MKLDLDASRTLEVHRASAQRPSTLLLGPVLTSLPPANRVTARLSLAALVKGRSGGDP
jgi:hypothetical protein